MPILIFAWFLLGIIYSFYMSFCRCLSQFPSKLKKNLWSFLRKRSWMHLLEYYQEHICEYWFLETLVWALWYTFPSKSVPLFFNIETYRTDILVFALYLHQHDDTLCLHGVYYIFCSFAWQYGKLQLFYHDLHKGTLYVYLTGFLDLQ